MTRPLLLDLFCGAGGAAQGYSLAGFEVYGIDKKPQPHYPFRFYQADVMELDPAYLGRFDAIHASPPCQAFTALRVMWNRLPHDDLLTPTRRALQVNGLPYVIENVPGAPMADDVNLFNVARGEYGMELCGTMFGLSTDDAELRRHRLFETNWLTPVQPHCRHGSRPRVIGVYGGHGRDRRRTVNTQDYSTEARREAMGIDWMTGAELSQAIPPAYTRFIGEQLLEHLERVA